MEKNILALDELEIAIQLVQLENPEMKKATYQELSDEVAAQFNAVVDVQDVYLLYEPTIQQLEYDAELYYGQMFNISRNDQFY